MRDTETSRKSVEAAIEEDLRRGKVFYEKCDTGDLESVNSFARKVQDQFPAINLLINNGWLHFQLPRLLLTSNQF